MPPQTRTPDTVRAASELQAPPSDDDRFLTVLATDWQGCMGVKECRLDVSKFKIYELTRAGRSIHWFCDMPARTKDLIHLENRGARLDSDLADEILQNVSPKKPLAKSAFTTEPRFTKSDSALFTNGVLQLAVCDRIKFSLIRPDSTVHRPPTLPTLRPEQLGANVKACLALSDGWHSTLGRFDDAFARAASAPATKTRLTSGQTPISSLAVGAEDPYRAGSTNVAVNTSLSSLATGASGSDLYFFYAAVKHNFCLASLGLVALCIPPKMNKKAKWESVLVMMKEKFATNAAHKTTITLLGRLSEEDLLRAIYFAVAFSPFSLICDRRVAIDPVLKKMHIHDIAEALCYLRRPYDDYRLRIEHALFRLIRKMATDGSDIFENEMRAILALERAMPVSDPMPQHNPAVTSSGESFRRINKYVAGIVYSNHGFLAQYSNSARVTTDDLRKDLLSFVLYTLKGIKTSPLRQWGLANELPVSQDSKRGRDKGESDHRAGGQQRRRVGSGSSLNFEEKPLASKAPTRRDFIRSLTEPWPIWPATSKLVVRFKDIVSPMAQRSLIQLEAHRAPQWGNMKRSDRVALVHEQRAVIGTWMSAARAGPYRITCWDEDKMCELINQDDWVRVDDLSLDKGEQTYVAPVSTILGSLGDGNTTPRALSCAYIPADCSDSIIPRELRDLDDGRTVDLLGGSTRHEWSTITPAGVSSRSVWVHIASRSNTSELELTTSGLCTYLSPLIGSLRVYLPEKIESGKTDTENAWKGLSARDASCWKVCQIQRNQEIVLKPDTPHFIVHDEDCLALTVNFYCCGTVGDSLKAILRQHYCGGTTTVGPLRDSAPVVFFKLFAVVVQELKRSSSSSSSNSNSGAKNIRIKLPEKFRTWGDVADLALLVDHLDQLRPRLSMTDPRKTTSELWQSTDAFKRDHPYAKKLVRSYLEFIVDVKCDEAIETFHTKAEDLRRLVLEYNVEQKHRHDLHVKVEEYKL